MVGNAGTRLSNWACGQSDVTHDGVEKAIR